MQKILDRLQRPIRELRISITDRCNLRCDYCMPAEVFGPDYAFLPKKEILSYEELTRLVNCFAQLGVEKVRSTGGEPLLRRDVDSLIRGISKIDSIKDLALTTNAILLSKWANRLKDAGLERINVSLDSLDPEIFAKMSGKKVDPQTVVQGIDAATQAGLKPKVNMVVKKGVNETQVRPLAKFCKDRGITLRFIEYMDTGNHNDWSLDKVYSAQDILNDLGKEHTLEPLKPNNLGEVAKRYQYAGENTEIGIISSITKPFCRDCNRARLSSNGQLYTCLFTDKGHDIKSLIKSDASDEVIIQQLADIWSKRTDRYSEIRHENEAKTSKVEMSHIGG